MPETGFWGPSYHPDGTTFRLWAPDRERMLLRIGGADHPMQRRPDGTFELVRPAEPGDPYAFVVDEGTVVPDPVSRRQAGDVHGASCVVDPDAYAWTAAWTGAPWETAVIYELHLGTFTPEGTFAAAAARLPYLAELGITAVEIMPVAQFSGNRGWGYDGVLPYAPHPAYGTPEEMKAFVDAAHAHGLMVLLDVVYNHFGPDGNYLHLYAEDFFDARRQTPWGAAIAYYKRPVREFFIQNALYWVREFRLDGLRLDAIDQVRDESEPEILVEIAERIRAEITDRPVHLTTEDNRNVTHLHERGEGGAVGRYTAEWNDDFHNAAHVAVTGETEGYYAGFAEAPWWLLARSLAEGFGFQGEPAPPDGKRRGEPSAHLPPQAFVDFLQNHDQTGNRAFGERLIALGDRRLIDALTAVLLLSPHIPMMFMGEEYGETRPFRFFTDFHGELAAAVRDGRRREFADFPQFSGPGADLSQIPDPNDPATFEGSKIDWSRTETDEGRAVMERVKDLLALRRAKIVPLLDGAGGDSGRLLSHEDGRIAVDWRLGGHLLELRANLTDEPAALPEARGERIFATAGEPAGPMSVSVHLSALA